MISRTLLQQTIAWSGLVLLLACQETDLPGPDSEPVSASRFAPYSPGNYWVYQRVNIDKTTGSETVLSSLDSLYISRDSLVDDRLFSLMEGSLFGLPFARWLAVDGPDLVDLQGRVYMSTDPQTLAASWSADYVSNPVVDSVFRTLRHEFENVQTAAGEMASYHQYDRWFYLSTLSGYAPSPALERDAYAAGIGVVMYRSFYVSSPLDVEMRLLRYRVD